MSVHRRRVDPRGRVPRADRRVHPRADVVRALEPKRADRLLRGQRRAVLGGRPDHRATDADGGKSVFRIYGRVCLFAAAGRRKLPGVGRFRRARERREDATVRGHHLVQKLALQEPRDLRRVDRRGVERVGGVFILFSLFIFFVVAEPRLLPGGRLQISKRGAEIAEGAAVRRLLRLRVVALERLEGAGGPRPRAEELARLLLPLRLRVARVRPERGERREDRAGDAPRRRRQRPRDARLRLRRRQSDAERRDAKRRGGSGSRDDSATPRIRGPLGTRGGGLVEPRRERLRRAEGSQAFDAREKPRRA